ncbi:MAG: transposase [Planctomycetota bacterium]|nr:MAG: transposase [Planctomycetota bacterium]
MLKRIVHPSAFLVTFVTLLHLNLSKPQRRHLLRTADAIIVCEGRKTLANLYRQWVEAPDASAVADFFRVSPWEAEDIYQALGPFAIADMLRRAEEEGAEPIIWASIDDSATRKDKDTHALEAVDWIFDHSASGKGQTAYCKGAVHVTLRIQIGAYSYTFAWRLYLREKTVRRLNRRRPKGKRLRFKSKYHLAREMLEELYALLPEGYTVYVLFDRWYGSGKLIKFIRRQGWHVICALKRNRTLNDIRVAQWDQRLRHKRYTRIRVPAADGATRTYLVRSVQGHLSGVPFDVCVLISRRHNRDKHPKYFLCTDLTLTAQTVLIWYGNRWPLEVDYWYLKQPLGLGDFRVQAYEAIEKWYAVLHLVLTFLQWRLHEARERGQPLRSLADVIHQQRAEHAQEVLTSACQEAIRMGSIEPVLQRFIAAPVFG